jgi:hypothetical protein
VNWFLCYKKSSNLAASYKLLNVGGMFPLSEIFDLRLYNKTISDAAIANYYRNVAVNKGNAYLPGYIEL